MPAPELRTARLLLRGWRESDLGPFAALNSDPEVMRYFPAPLNREDGWRLARPAWGSGYATEAATAVLAIAFDELRLDEVVSFTAAQNARSRAVTERIGMVRDGHFEHPAVPESSLLRRHVLYRLRNPRSRL